MNIMGNETLVWGKKMIAHKTRQNKRLIYFLTTPTLVAGKAYTSKVIVRKYKRNNIALPYLSVLPPERLHQTKLFSSKRYNCYIPTIFNKVSI